MELERASEPGSTVAMLRLHTIHGMAFVSPPRLDSRSASSGTRQASGADGAAAPLMHTVQWRRCAGRERQGKA